MHHWMNYRRAECSSEGWYDVTRISNRAVRKEFPRAHYSTIIFIGRKVYSS